MFLNLDITFEEGTLILKLLDKRDSFLFPIVRVPHIERNIPQNIFYSAIKDEFLRIARFCYKLFTKIKNTPLKCGIIVYGLLSTMNQIAYSPNAGIFGNELYILSHMNSLRGIIKRKNKLL